MIDDVGADDGRCHRGQNVDRKFGKVLFQHDRPLPASGLMREL
jgi:hypothetical protein